MSSVEPAVSIAHSSRPQMDKSKSSKKPSKFTKNKQFASSNNSIQADDSLPFSKYKSEIPTLLEVFPNWTKTDLFYALEEAEGDLEIAISRISEVKSRKDKLQDAKRASKSSNASANYQGKSTKLTPNPNLHPKKHYPKSSETGSVSNKATDSKASGSTALEVKDTTSSSSDSKTTSETRSSPNGIEPNPNTKSKHSPSLRSESSKYRGKTFQSKSRQPEKPAAVPPPPSNAPVSWAKIAKRAIKTSPPPSPKQKPLSKAPLAAEKPSESSPEQIESKDQPPQVSPEDTSASLESVSSAPEQNSSEPVSESPEVSESLPNPDTTTSSKKETSATESSSVPEDTSSSNIEKSQQEVAQSTPKSHTHSTRILKQKEAVVMPPGAFDVDQLGLKFGHLSTKQANLPADSISADPAVTEAKPAATTPAAASTEAPETSSQTTSAEQKPAASKTSTASSQPQNPLAAYAAAHQNDQQYQQTGALPLPQGPLPNDFGANVLYRFDANRFGQMGGYYNENNTAPYPNPKEENTSTHNAPSAVASNTGPVSVPIPPGSGIGMGSYSQQFQPNAFQNLNNVPMLSPMYFNMNMMQPSNQFPNPNLGSNYNQPFIKQQMYQMYHNNPQNLSMQQFQLQQLNITQASQYGSYPVNAHSNQQQTPGSFDSEPSQTQNVQQYSLGNNQIPGFFASGAKPSQASGSNIPSIPNNKETQSSSSSSSNQQGNHPATIIGGTTFYPNPQQQPGYQMEYSNPYQQSLSPQQYYNNYSYPQQHSYSHLSPSQGQQGQQAQQGHHQAHPQANQYAQQAGVSSAYGAKHQYNNSGPIHSAATWGLQLLWSIEISELLVWPELELIYICL
ncbi:hypothetical protein BB560_001772 [Smittium megazygosporum]|uniref:RNA polymerase II degradation factor 1 n=1 Tax=Smittium megazygosporum TaxID=133381 RepID=A0A2T9ZGM0_9FUNG|nr:hypothetical protein BB560_001772 [Smittium megazygosporum]